MNITPIAKSVANVNAENAHLTGVNVKMFLTQSVQVNYSLNKEGRERADF